METQLLTCYDNHVFNIIFFILAFKNCLHTKIQMFSVPLMLPAHPHQTEMTKSSGFSVFVAVVFLFLTLTLNVRLTRSSRHGNRFKLQFSRSLWEDEQRTIT